MHYKCNQTQYPVWLLLSNQPGSLHTHCWWDISQLHTSIVEFTFIDICHSMFSLLWRFSVTGSIRTLRQSFGLLRIHYFLFALHLKVMTWTQDLQESSIKKYTGWIPQSESVETFWKIVLNYYLLFWKENSLAVF